MDRDFDTSFDKPIPIIVSVKGDSPIAAPLKRVELDLTRFHSGRWALQLDAVMAKRAEPAVILAQGVACLAVAWWAQLSPRSYLTNIRGAILLSPLSYGFGQSAMARNVRTSPGTKLPFPSIVACDPSPAVEQVLALADGWGSRFVDTSSLATGGPSNRRSAGSHAEERLVDLLTSLGNDVFAHAAPAGVDLEQRLALAD
ncbi:MAG: alpha/beta hydrolase [Sphingomonas sp.]|uniref:alpha/beta hydrolase n=1 Tax=Sphingomonas sp. TaxID=28214 RepID=UPI003F7DF391